MQGQRIDGTMVHKILIHLRKFNSVKKAVRELGACKQVVRQVKKWATVRGFLSVPELPPIVEIERFWKEDHALNTALPTVRDHLEPLRDHIVAWLDARLDLTRIHVLLKERHGWTGSYETLKRFTRPLRISKNVCVRLETKPGEEAQVDFGYMGLLWDEIEQRLRKAWCFLMTLSHSRHFYAEIVFGQDVKTWIACHRNAFEFFGGVPHKMVIDNLKAAIIKAVLYEPMINRTYSEFAAHYNFVISPCAPGRPEHKGKVERGVPYVRNSFWKGSDFGGKQAANTSLIDWITNTAGLRIHGTTKQKPIIVFENIEKNCLQPLPQNPYRLSLWATTSVRHDCHVTIDGAFYSAPHHLCYEDVLIQSTEACVRIFHKNHLVTTHLKAPKGERRTDHAHYPPHKVAYLEKTPQWCLARASDIGLNCREFIETLFQRKHPYDNLRSAHGVLGLVKKYSAERVESACKRTLHYGANTYQAIKNILEKNLDLMPCDENVEATPAQLSFYEFARPVEDFLHSTQEEEEQWISSTN